MPATATALDAWNGEGAPGEAVYAAFAADLKAAPRADVAEIAKRLNYYETGMRSMLIKTARAIRDAEPPYQQAFVAVDEQWGTPHYWRILKQAMPELTGFYLLAALDLTRDESGAITAVTPENAVHVDVLDPHLRRV